MDKATNNFEAIQGWHREQMCRATLNMAQRLRREQPLLWAQIRREAREYAEAAQKEANA